MRISTAPVEYAPPSLEFNFQKEIARLKYLKSKLHDCRMLKEKMNEMESDSRVKSFFDYKSSSFARVLEWENLNENELYLLKCVVAAGQGRVFGEFGSKLKGAKFNSTRNLVKSTLYALTKMIETWDVNGRWVGG
ncbi:UDP-glucose pyrophosphorylase 3 [Forsythia ovata]|uniref:UDP-glucose pyrophosphorylase 3 n=1 Tax=Forsythia ovata TaxID=205694 RepID=A0ABD1PYG5_9LAMI